MYVCAFDIGGTNIKYGVLNKQGHIVFKSEASTDAERGGLAILEGIKSLIDNLQKHYVFNGIAVSTAGQINTDEGSVVYATDSIPGYIGLNIKKELERAFDLPVFVDNDVNCAALGEYWKGVAKGVDFFLCLTLGTGIGGAIVTNGLIYQGTNYSAGEFGHITLHPDGEICSCGDYGCYEQYASSSALEKMAKNRLNQQITLPTLFTLSKRGEEEASLIVDEWVENIVLGLKTLVHIFNPPLIIIGGGVSSQGDYLLSKIKQKVKDKIMVSFQDNLSIKMAEQANDANLYGASFQLYKNMEN